MSITRQIVQYIINADFKHIPSNAIKKTKELILDDIGNALGGSVLKSSKIILQWGKLWRGIPEATLISDGTKVPAAIASGVNTQLSMGLDFMETYRNIAHPGSGMVMTALALGERERVDGKTIITAVCTAYDVTGRIIDATFPTPEYRRKVWNESWQGCGSLVVAIKLLKLNEEEAMHAFGMGLGNAPTMNVHNILYVPASMSKCGNQFHNFVAVNAAILAKLGYTGYHEILDEPYAYWTTISDVNRPEVYTRKLGEEFLILSAMSLKPWPTCRWAQPGIESLLDIMADARLTPVDIEQVTYHAHEKVTKYPYDNTDPQTPEDAYWSVPWAFANAALGYKPGPAWYSNERFGDLELKKFMQKVKIKTLPEAVETFATQPEKSITVLEVKTKDGKVYSKRTEYCKGDPQKPLTHEEVIDKFLKQTDEIIAQEKAYKLVDYIENLEKLGDISEISDLLH